jgi:hypothetical protein
LIYIPFLIIDMVIARHSYGDGYDDVAANGDLAAI